MIYPTRRSIVLAAAGAPPALLAGLIAPQFWAMAGGWVALILGLVLVDALVGPARSEASLELATPRILGMAGRGEAVVAARFAGAAPPNARLAVQTNERLVAHPDRLGLIPAAGPARIALTPVRRGEGEVANLWLRWTGPLGLVWKQIRAPVRRTIAVVPNIEAVKAEAVRLFSRQALAGLKTQLDTGEGADFHALKELIGPMDMRTIDWKQSARHTRLLGKEFRAERNHPVVFAIDCGRAMCEPVDGAPRLDLALNAALLTAFVSLKLGDRAAIFGFDSRPRLFTGLLAGTLAFERLRRLSAALDYGAEETNYTLGLTQLGAALQRRSLVVVFTDFADSTTAELMIENVTRLVRRHLALFVVFADEELEAMVDRAPRTAEDVTAAVTAAALLRDREVVIERLRRLGVHILETRAGRLGPALISAYLDLKRRDLW
ncbi:MAG TPA: DUF58 domain-containing protein [Caulobacteraceae bacterium]|nr:DUF58 domain-containing protein [Caulobacteraceae bacterium]